ncbi:MAG: NAD(+) synthase [Candidatus Krumholzibacteriota bacterium]|nr:NAD(+) synthase [Candidatus Krumholzibacteriota bacterium]
MSDFHRDVLKIDAERASEELAAKLSEQIVHRLHRQGAVVGVSGGIDSATVAALCCKALGPERVLGVAMPEKDSSPESYELARELAAQYGFTLILEDLEPALAGLGCYPRRDEAVARVFPDYTPAAKFKIVLPTNLLESERLNVFRATVEYPDGRVETRRLPVRDYLQIVSASNMKQRSRMLMLYYHAEVKNYAVVGTGNKNEHDQGFFVKWGDGGADLKPIAHLYKTQVYQIAEALGVPAGIRERTPTTDTYSAEATQEEFFFALPFALMDLLHWAWENKADAAEVAGVLDLTVEQVERVWRDFARKWTTTEYLRLMPLHWND